MFSSDAMRFALSPDPDATFCEQLDHLLGQTAAHSGVAPPAGAEGRDWHARPFSPLLLGYTGQGNVGADVRVREMVRQLHTLFTPGTLRLQLGVMGDVSGDPVLGPLDAVPLAAYFTDFLRQQGPRFDGVIACEGSMFTSTFSDVLSATFAGGLGYAARRGQLAVGYGAEAGAMSPGLKAFVTRACEGTLLVARSGESQALLGAMGLRVARGADPAWTFEPSAEARDAARAALQAQGWDGQQPAVALCPINPFWWPVRVDMAKTRALQAPGDHAELRDTHYRGVFFHTTSPEREAHYAHYLDALAQTVATLRASGRFVFLVGMERLDARSCAHLNQRLPAPAPTFCSGDFTPDAIVGLLRSASLVVTSRFHAAVLALGGLVPTIGIALDSRIHNLFAEAGLGEWFTRGDSPALHDELAQKIAALATAEVSSAYRRLVRRQIQGIGEMGRVLADELRRVLPDAPLAPLGDTWQAHLPPLSPRLAALVHSVD